jgi:hypothetical protein
MTHQVSLAERLPPDTLVKLVRAAGQRFSTAEFLRGKRRLEALYLYGYSAEMCLAAAYYRSAGFRPHDIVDRDTRQRRMAQARQLRTSAGEPLMSSDPHPLIGWARFLEWQRTARADLPKADAQRLKEAINKAAVIYRYWRPELRYKTLQILEQQLDIVRRAANWLLKNQNRL